MPLISIISPVYNVGKWLRQSIDSLMMQHDIEDCEIIFVNDGSTDDSLSILMEYTERYANIKIIDKKNEGVSTARNCGLDEATGEYIYFMDSDDLLHPQWLGLIRHEIATYSPDIVSWEFAAFYKRPKINNINIVKSEEIDNSTRQAFNCLSTKGFAVSLWNKAIRRSLLRTIRIDPSMTYGEDMFFSWKALLIANSVRHINAPLYFYRQSGRGATMRYHAGLYETYKKAFADILAFVKEKGLATDSLLKDIDYHFACRLPSLTTMESRAPYGKVEKRRHLKEVISDPSIQRALKDDERLQGDIYYMAREGNVDGMLRRARINALKFQLLFPIKRLLK